MYRIIGHPRTRALRAIQVCEELGAPYEIVNAGPGSPEALAAHPEGRTPALVTEEGPLDDSLAIITWLADKHGDAATGPSFPAGSYQRGLQDGHTQFIVTEMEGPLTLTARHTKYLPEELRLAGMRENAERQFARAVDAFLARLGDNAYLMGERFTLPDLLAASCLDWGRLYSFAFAYDGVAERFCERVMNRPAFQRAEARVRAALGE